MPALAPPPLNSPQTDKNGQTNALWSRWYLDAQQTVVLQTAPANALYLVATANPSLTAEIDLGALSAGFLQQTVALGVANVTTTATIPASVLTGALPALDASALTSLNASQLASGTVPDARFPATLPALNGSALTALNATNLASGTVPDARFPATLPAASGINLTALKGVNVTHAVVTVIAAQSPYTVLSSDETILVNAVAGAVTITLPTATSGRILAIKKTDASGNAVTLSGTVDTVVNPTLTVQFQSRVIQADGSAWQVVAGFL